MQAFGIFDEVSYEVGDIIVAGVNGDTITKLLNPDREELNKLVTKA